MSGKADLKGKLNK